MKHENDWFYLLKFYIVIFITLFFGYYLTGSLILTAIAFVIGLHFLYKLGYFDKHSKYEKFGRVDYNDGGKSECLNNAKLRM